MKISDKYTNTLFDAEDLEAAKLKLKNECPKVLGKFVDSLQSKPQRGLKKVLGLKAKPPLAVVALADLRPDKTLSTLSTDVWTQARSFISAQAQATAPVPTHPPIKKTDSFSSVSTGKSVSFSDTDSVVEFDKALPPKQLI